MIEFATKKSYEQRFYVIAIKGCLYLFGQSCRAWLSKTAYLENIEFQ